MSQDYEIAVRLSSDGSGLVAGSEKAAASLDKVTQASDKVTRSFGQVFTATEKHTQATEDETQAIAKLDAELEALLGRLDPVQRQVSSLNNAQGLLTRSVQAGLLSQQQYTAALAQANAMYGQAEDAANKSAFATAGARRELIVLGHEAISGNFSRMPGSFMVLAERADLSAMSIAGVVGPLAILATVAGGAAYAFAQGAKEVAEMNNALALSGNFAGTTRGGMEAMAQSVSRAGTLTIATSKDVVTAVAASGRYSSDNVLLLSSLVDNFARSTGSTVDKVTPELVKMFENPAKASEALNQQMHYLGVSELERIRNLQETGRMQEAVTAALNAATGAMPNHASNIGYIESAWIKAKKAISDYWDIAKGLGRAPTAQDAVASAKAGVTGAQALGANPQILADANAALDTALRQQAVEEKLAKIRSDALEKVEQQLQAQKAVEKSITSQIGALERERDLITGAGGVAGAPDSPAKAERLREINKQIGDLQRSMGAEAAQMANQRIASTLQLRDITLAMAADQNDTTLKLGQINQADHDRTKAWLDQQKNAMQQIAVQEQLNVGNMTAGQRQALQLTLARLQAESAAIGQRGGNQGLIDDNNAKKAQEQIINAMIDGVNKLGDADLKRLQQSIAAQRLHNDEIGKTKEQIDKVKQAAADADTAKLQAQADAIAGLLTEQGLDQNVVDIYTAMLVQLNAQIAARRELSGLIGDAGVKEKNAAEIKAQGENFTRMWNTVEQTGKTVFSYLMSGGTNAAKAIGQAFKASVVDLLYQLTLRPFIIQAGLSISGAMGITTSALAQSGAAGLGNGIGGIGNGLGAASGVSSLFGGGGTGGMLSGLLGSPAVPMVDVLGTGSSGMIAGDGLLGMLGGAGAGIAAALPWIGGALAIGGALGLFGDGGGPKGSDAGIKSQVGPDGKPVYSVVINNASDGTDMGQVAAFNSMLQDNNKYDQATLANMVGTQVSPGSPTDTATLISQLTAALQPAAAAAQASLQNEQSRAKLIIDQMTATLQLADAVRGFKAQVDGFNLTDLSPLSPQDKLDFARQQYSAQLGAAQGGDAQALSNLGNSAQAYLQQARDFYASSPAYAAIFQGVQSDTSGLTNTLQSAIENQLTGGAVDVASMNKSLTDLVGNTANLDSRIATALAKAMETYTASNVEAARMQTQAIVQALVENNSTPQLTDALSALRTQLSRVATTA